MVGDTGAIGLVGYAGIIGLKGEQGDTGPEGLPGKLQMHLSYRFKFIYVQFLIVLITS